MTLPTTHDQPDDLLRFAAALAGQYEIEREIGRGGMGIVYAARDVKLDRPVAIKTLPPHLTGDAVIRERFLREARTAGGLSHAGIVPVHRADELAGHVFFVMSLIGGESLAQRVRGGRVTTRDAVLMLRDVAAALGYAHRRGIVHRDVKAENILIDDASGHALVTDFGIARLAESAPLTSTGQMLGTVYYLSPEQISGDAVDGRSDLYSLGVVGYFALSGRFPFEAPLASAVIIAHVTKPAPALRSVAPHVPATLAAIIDRCLSKDPAQRFQTGEELSAALEKTLDEVDAAASLVATSAPTTQSLISDTEARAIWQRAATLQADTGVVPRPAPVAAARDVERDLTRTSGYQLGNVRAAALEAGIPAPYVEHALAEHGLAGLVTTRGAQLPAKVNDRSSGGKWIGAPTTIEFEVVLEGEIPSQDFDLFGEIIQRTVGEDGILSSVGRSLTWHSAHHQEMQITVLARGGTTTIRATRSIREIAAAMTAMGLAIGGLGTGSILVALVRKTGLAASSAASLWTVAVGLAFVTVATVVGTISRYKSKRVRSLVERLADEVQKSIDAAKPKKLLP